VPAVERNLDEAPEDRGARPPTRPAPRKTALEVLRQGVIMRFLRARQHVARAVARAAGAAWHLIERAPRTTLGSRDCDRSQSFPVVADNVQHVERMDGLTVQRWTKLQ
jgi:hypothetical protein